MKEALKNIPDAWRGETLSVEYFVTIKPNPGSIGEYKIQLKPGG